jgi:hypothetical protein
MNSDLFLRLRKFTFQMRNLPRESKFARAGRQVGSAPA